MCVPCWCIDGALRGLVQKVTQYDAEIHPNQKHIMNTEDKLLQKLNFAIDPYGDGLDADFTTPRGELTLFPSNGNSAKLTVTLQYSNGKPAPGKTVTCQSR